MVYTATNHKLSDGIDLIELFKQLAGGGGDTTVASYSNNYIVFSNGTKVCWSTGTNQIFPTKKPGNVINLPIPFNGWSDWNRVVVLTNDNEYTKGGGFVKAPLQMISSTQMKVQPGVSSGSTIGMGWVIIGD